jgi:hypothetical protein
MSLTYYQAQREVFNARWLNRGRPWGNETRLFWRGSRDVEVRYRDLAVVTLHEDRTYSLRMGERPSATVRRRVEENSPVLIRIRQGAVTFTDANGTTYFFLEGVRVNGDGTPVGEWVTACVVDNTTPDVAPEGHDYVRDYCAHLVKITQEDDDGVLPIGGRDCTPPSISEAIRTKNFAPSILWSALGKSANGWKTAQTDAASGRIGGLTERSLLQYVRENLSAPVAAN